MDCRTIRALLAAAGLALAGTPLTFEMGAQAQALDAVDDSTVLHLTESAQRAVRQDRLTIELRVEANSPDAARVQAAVNRHMNSALERARATQGVDAETRGYVVRQERPQNQPARWHGQQGLILHGTDAAVLLKLAGELQQAGFVMSNMVYDVAPETARALEDELTAKALERLSDRVKKIAEAMKLELRNYKNLQVGNVSGNRPPIASFARLAPAAGEVSAPPPAASPGETTLTVSVSADVVLIPHGAPP